ncbi:hypothetical protein ACS0TY_007667 [Phlomoides rotata]
MFKGSVPTTNHSHVYPHYFLLTELPAKFGFLIAAQRETLSRADNGALFFLRFRFLICNLRLISCFFRFVLQLFFSYFKDLVGREVTVELKNDLAIRGTLHSVDQYLNIKLENTRVVDQDKYPHMLSVRNCFIRGSVVRYVQLPPEGVDVELLHDATRREARGG